MPLEIAIYFTEEKKPQIHKLQVNKEKNVFFIDVKAKPEKITLDPNLWVLMDANFQEAK